MKTIKLPVRKVPLRLINWANVTTVEKDEKSDGVVIYFVDGRRIVSPMTMQEAELAIQKYWRTK